MPIPLRESQLLTLVCFLVVVQAQPVVHLSPTGSPNWSGSCSVATCTRGNPCGFPRTISYSEINPCEIYFMAGDYRQTALQWISNTPLANITMEDGISTLNLTLLYSTAPAPVINFWSNSSSSLARLNGFGFLLLYRVASPTVRCTGIAFDTFSVFALTVFRKATVIFERCKFEKSTTPPMTYFLYIDADPESQVIISESVIVSSPGTSPFIISMTPSTIEFHNTNFSGDSIAAVYSKNNSSTSHQILFTGASNIHFYGPSLISFNPSEGYDVPSINITLDGLGGYQPLKRSSLDFSAPQPLGVTISPIGPQPIASFWYSQVQHFRSVFAHVSRMHLNSTGGFEAESSNFDSCAFDISLDLGSGAGSIFDANFTIFSSESYLEIFIGDNFLWFSQTAVHIEASQKYRQPFIIDTHGVPSEILPYNSLTTNALWLTGGSHLIMENLTVSEMISSTNSSFAQLSASNFEPSQWSFNSIVTTNIVLDLTNLDMLKYTATAPELGIRVEPSSLLPINPPPTILFDCQDSVALVNDTWFPLMNQLSTMPSKVIWTGAPTINPSISFNVSSRVLEYQFSNLPPSIPPTSTSTSTPATPSPSLSSSPSPSPSPTPTPSPTTTPTPQLICPPPPPGFSCMNGMWVSDDVDGNVTTVTVPGNSGVVQVVGNLTVEEVIIFEGTGTQLNVSGCLKVPSVELNLEGVNEPSKGLPSGSVVLLQQNGYDCPDSLLDSLVSVKQNSKSCEKVKVDRDDSKSSSSSLVVLFSVDESKCSSGTWRWIVLGSVLGVVLIAGLLASLIWRISKSKRTGIKSLQV